MAAGRTEKTWRNSLYWILSVITVFSQVYCVSMEDSRQRIGKSVDDATNVNVRNLDGTTDRRTSDVYVTDNKQDPVSPELLGGIIIQHESQKLSARLRWLSNDEIGITNMQAIFDSLPYVKKESDEYERLREIAQRLQLRFRNYLQVLRTNKITVENLFKFHVKQPITQPYDCCSIPCKHFKSESLYGCKINRQTSCDLIPPSIPRASFNPGRNLTEVWRSNTHYFPSLKWQYFISVVGLHNEFPASSFRWLGDCHVPTAPRNRHTCHNIHDTRHRDVFLSTIQPQRKHVVIMMDHGNSMSVTQLRTAKAIVKHLIASFSNNDRIGVIGLSNKPMYPRADPCLPHTLVPATFETRIYFSKFIDSLEKQDTTTNHSLGFLTAFEMIEDVLLNSSILSDNAMILYVSRGLLSSLTDAREVMDVVSLHNARTGHKVIINTYAVIDDGKPIMYEKSFMQDIAYQNFAKYDVKYRLKTPVVRGIMMAINSTQDLSSSVGRFYLPLNRTAQEDPVFSLPYMDEADGALTLSISQPCFHSPVSRPERLELIGMVGVDLHMEDIVQDITYYNNNDMSYTFLITTEGYTIQHPAFQRPLRTSLQPMHTDIRHFEQHAGFETVRQTILSREEGHTSLLLELSNHTAPDGQIIEVERVVKYFWKKVDKIPYIVVLKSFQTAREQRVLKGIHMHNQPELVYHRIDLLPHDKMCLHLKQLATLEISTVFLSPSSFINPFEHLTEEETKRSVQSYLAYLQDDTRLITNPGLKESVRNDVGASSRINMEWIRRYQTSNLKDFIIRRYIGMPSGVLRMFPGTLLDKSFEPTQRAWYSNALKYPGHVTLSAPYLDVGGAGYIITISHTIFEGKPAALHSPSDKVVAVMGMDITLGYFHKLLADLIPACEQTSIRCFLMDDEGYLVAHPGLIDPTGKGPAEQRHITHMEPLVANDILNHRHFVRKRLCNRYNDRTVQRYFDFNTSFSGVLTNLAHGEHCARYQITHITGTNAFLGIVNHTCETATAFCPCSMYDRLCLNCNRMEQTECECPCECPLDMDLCSGELVDIDDSNPSCPHDPEHEQLMVASPDLAAQLSQCYDPKCDSRKNKLDCLGVVDCQWCQVEKDGQTPLKAPSCNSQRVCFGGVVAAHSPYGDEISAESAELDAVTMKSTPVGPVAGGIMGCFLLLALGVYCYRHHVHRHAHQYVSTLPDNPHRNSHYYEDEAEPSDDTTAGHTNFVLASFENPASISPYRVNTSYRRPAGGDSDHGYSTMTPHEDSEHASLPCLDPHHSIIAKDRFKPAPYTTVLSSHHPSSTTSTPPVLPPPPPSSSSRRSRSPTPPHTRLSSCYSPIPELTCLTSEMMGSTTVIPGATSVPGTTNLKGPHSVIANVQVHMVDSH